MSALKKYEYVITIAQCGGISQASEKLQIAQPTLSKYIKKLEADLGVELFDRSTIPLKTTRAGELFIEVGTRMLNLEKQFAKQLDELKQNQNTLIRVGISPSRSPHMMPLILEKYRQIHPQGHVIIEERTTTELTSRLLGGDLDLIISLEDEDTLKLERVKLFKESILLVVARDYAKGFTSALELLNSIPLISVGKGQIMWQAMRNILSELSISEPIIECQSIESALALVKRGIGATLVPSYVFDFSNRENGDLAFYQLPLESYPELASSLERQVCLFYRKEQFLTQAEHDFIDCVKQISSKN
ncbi:MAG: LysR family transcriptional regulator [Clostridia bacterium]|nr:LysR family transcriptional regulator [Clostridia bacterium]